MNASTRGTIRRRALAGMAAAVLSAGLMQLHALADQNEGITPASAVVQGHIAVGGLHSCAVLTDGHVQCWGSNDQGQLGNGTVTTSTVPTPVMNISTAVAITAGNTHTCALLSDATVQCWGLDGNGQLGDGVAGDQVIRQIRRLAPVAVTGISGATAIAAGGFHTCALLTGGTVKCWGDDGIGQLGDGKPGDKTLIAAPVSGLTNATSLSAGEFHTCALLTDGTVKCWGHNGFGQLGDGTSVDRSLPVAVAGLPNPAGDTPNPVVAQTTGYGHSCALLKDNTARCWGENNFGQLGYATPVVDKVMQPSLVPKTVQHNNDPTVAPPAPQTYDLVDQGSMIAISAGQFHNCALINGGAVRCWGGGGRGQLGTDPNPYSKNPKEIEDSTYTVNASLAVPASAVSAGGFDTCAIVGSSVRCWGYNFYGQLGSRESSSLVPVQVSAVTGATTVAAGTGFACALIYAETPVKNIETALKPVCWGDNGNGQLGANVAVPKSSIRTAVVGIPLAVALDAGNGHACALTSVSSTPKCWGFNNTGQLGDGTTATSASPVAVNGLTNATSINAGGALGSAERGHTCALSATAKALCWGRNGNGQLGVENADHTTSDSSTPVVVQYDSDPAPPEPGNDHVALADLPNVTAVVAGGFHSCAVTTDKTLWCWGFNGSGQLGDKTATERHLAVHVQKDDSDPDHDNPLTDVVAIAAGSNHTCARLVDYSLKCWGDNGSGRLGDGTTTDRRLPTQVSGLTGGGVWLPPGTDKQATVITAGDSHTCAVRGDGALLCWGYNGQGQLGDGSMSSRTTPTVVKDMEATDSSVPTNLLPVIKSLSASRENTCVALIDTTVYCWGSNATDQLGDGIGALSLSPKSVALSGAV